MSTPANTNNTNKGDGMYELTSTHSYPLNTPIEIYGIPIDSTICILTGIFITHTEFIGIITAYGDPLDDNHEEDQLFSMGKWVKVVINEDGTVSVSEKCTPLRKEV
jgi:hypothetical protein